MSIRVDDIQVRELFQDVVLYSFRIEEDLALIRVAKRSLSEAVLCIGSTPAERQELDRKVMLANDDLQETRVRLASVLSEIEGMGFSV